MGSNFEVAIQDCGGFQRYQFLMGISVSCELCNSCPDSTHLAQGGQATKLDQTHRPCLDYSLSSKCYFSVQNPIVDIHWI